MNLDKENDCTWCDEKYFYIYGMCQLCGRKCAPPLFDPNGEMSLQDYLKFADDWNNEENISKGI